MNYRMRAESYPSQYYIAGGTLPPDARSYVERKADHEIYQAILRGEFCYVLNSRQMGKSSLRIRTKERLEKESEEDSSQAYTCISVDVSNVGTAGITQEIWYYTITDAIASSDSLVDSLFIHEEGDLYTWWDRQSKLSPVRKFARFIETVLLSKLDGNIVIFIDEIDSVLRLDFDSDDFFAVIRDCYNQRAEKAKYRRLIFVLLGTATPATLVKDKRRTPFNIGTLIELSGFKLHEITPLVQGLRYISNTPENLVQEVIRWTDGQPFLTQKICKFLYNSGNTIAVGKENKIITDLIHERIIKNWESNDEPVHLRTIRDRLLNVEAGLSSRMFWLYKEILEEQEIASQPENNETIEQLLCLSGLVVKKASSSFNGTLSLKVSNRIYSYIFDRQWINEILTQIRPYSSEKIQNWLSTEKKENKYLLVDEELRRALEWAADKTLGDADRAFLEASRNKKLKEAAEAKALKLKNDNILSLRDLVYYSDKYPQEVVQNMRDGHLRGWLSSTLGEVGLADYADKVRLQYSKKLEYGLEVFIREICKKEGLSAYPKLSIQPERIDFGEVYFGDVAQRTLRLVKAQDSRGIYWGEINCSSSLSGIRVKSNFDYRQKSISVTLNTVAAQAGIYEGKLEFLIDGTDIMLGVLIRYRIVSPDISLSSSSFDFGKILSNESPKTRSLRIKSKPDQSKFIIDYFPGEKKSVYFLPEPKSYESEKKLILSKSNILNSTININPQELRRYGSQSFRLKLKINNRLYDVPIRYVLLNAENIVIQTSLVGASILFLLAWPARIIISSVTQSTLESRSSLSFKDWVLSIDPISTQETSAWINTSILNHFNKYNLNINEYTLYLTSPENISDLYEQDKLTSAVVVGKTGDSYYLSYIVDEHKDILHDKRGDRFSDDEELISALNEAFSTSMEITSETERYLIEEVTLSLGYRGDLTLSEYSLNLISLENAADLPQTNEKSVVVARIENSYHAQIYNRTGDTLVGKEKSKLSYDPKLMQLLDEIFKNQEAFNNQTVNISEQNDLIQDIISSLGYSAKSSDFLVTSLLFIILSIAGAIIFGTYRQQRRWRFDLRLFRFFFLLLLSASSLIFLAYLSPYILVFINKLIVAIFITIERIAYQPNLWGRSIQQLLINFSRIGETNIGGGFYESHNDDLAALFSPVAGWMFSGLLFGIVVGLVCGLQRIKERKNALVVFFVFGFVLFFIVAKYFPYELFTSS